MQGTSSPRDRWAAFSLLELLVAMAIGIVILAFCFPLANRVTTQSLTIRCVNHFRQLGSALGTYAGDHRGEWPWPIDERKNANPLPGTWIIRPLKHVSGRWTALGKLFPYVHDKRLYVCPANKGKTRQVLKLGDYASEDGIFPTDYLTRGFNQSSHPSGPNFRLLSQVSRRSIASCNFAYAASNPSSFPLSWHKGTYPVLFGDGSVAQIRFPEGAVNTKKPPNINDSTGLQIRIWDYFDGATTTLKLK